MKQYLRIITFFLLGTAPVFAANPSTKKDVNDPLHLSWIDNSIQPSQNFYAYANGTWQKENPIPADHAAWGSFNIVHEKVQQQIHQLLIKASENKKAKKGTIQQKVGDFYYSGMDIDRINTLGISPLQAEFTKIEALENLHDLQNALPHLHNIGVDALFGFGSMQDYKDSNKVIGVAVQGGLSLPDRDYYLKDDAKFKKIRKEFLAHVAKMLELLGDAPDKAAKEAQTVMKIETELAKASMPQVEQRNPHAVYHIMTLKQLEQVTPNFSWPEYFAALNVKKIKAINLAMPDFFKAMNKLVQQTPISEWKTYLRWHLLDAYAPFLSQAFVDQNFKMVSALTGAEKLQPRWKRVVATENGALGFAIGEMYVKKYFPPEAKREAKQMVENIRLVMRKNIMTLPWMSPETKKAALSKLDRMEVRVGYPSKWRDYTSLHIERDNYVDNIMRANEFLVRRDLNKIGKPLDRTEWHMTPQTINAYYDVSMNSMNFPAGILQAPFFDPKAPMALNYGSIGFVMGHEMTHGFDDSGAQFDGQGNLKNWWTPADEKKFKLATQCIADQFSKYTVDGGMHVQGKLVVGEAAADLGGLLLAYKAFQKSQYYKKAKTIGGLTPEQQFFLGAAHVWARNVRPQQIQNQVTTDPHPPAKYRVNGSLANIEQFQKAFNIPDDSPMVNKNRCVIW